MIATIIIADILATMFALSLALSLAFHIYWLINTDEEEDNSYPNFTTIPHSGAYDRVSKKSPVSKKKKKKIDAMAFDPELFRKHAKNSCFRFVHQQRQREAASKAAVKAALKVKKPVEPIVESIVESIVEPIQEPQLLSFGPYREPRDEFNDEEETKELLDDDKTEVTEPSSTQLFPNLKPPTFVVTKEPQLLSFGPYREPRDEFDYEDEETKELLDDETEVTEPSSTQPSSTQLFPNLKPPTFVVTKEPQLLSFGPYREPRDEFNDEEETKELLDDETEVTEPSSTQLFPNLKPPTFVIIQQAPTETNNTNLPATEPKEDSDPIIVLPAKSSPAREKKRLLEKWFRTKKNATKDNSDEETTTTTTSNEETKTEKKKKKKSLKKLKKKIQKAFQKKKQNNTASC